MPHHHRRSRRRSPVITIRPMMIPIITKLVMTTTTSKVWIFHLWRRPPTVEQNIRPYPLFHNVPKHCSNSTTMSRRVGTMYYSMIPWMKPHRMVQNGPNYILTTKATALVSIKITRLHWGKISSPTFLVRST